MVDIQKILRENSLPTCQAEETPAGYKRDVPQSSNFSADDFSHIFTSSPPSSPGIRIFLPRGEGISPYDNVTPHVPVPKPDPNINPYSGPEFQLLLDKVSNSRRTEGNLAIPLINGVEAFALRYKLMQDPDIGFILIKTMIFAGDETGREHVRLLKEAARAGKLVVLQYDFKGSITGPKDVEEMAKNATPEFPLGKLNRIRELEAAGVICVAMNVPDKSLQLKEWEKGFKRYFKDPLVAFDKTLESVEMIDWIDHEKYFVAGKWGGELYAIIGGMNIASEYAYGGTNKKDSMSGVTGWRDTDIYLKGPVVNDIVATIFNGIEFHSGLKLGSQFKEACNSPQKPAGGALARFSVNRPYRYRTKYLNEIYIKCLDQTPPGERVRIANAYFAPMDNETYDAIVRAARRGVLVEILTNSYETTDLRLLTDASRWYYWRLLKEAPNIRLYEAKPVPCEKVKHQKVASFGTNGPIIIGSFNLDPRATYHNSEDIVVVDDPEAKKILDEALNRDFNNVHAEEIILERLKRVPEYKKLTWWFAAVIAGYWL